jgi:coenzyme F420-reducing hydrogenase delta subunit
MKYLECIRVKSPECKVDVFYNLNKIKDRKKFILSSLDPRFHYVSNLKIDTTNEKNIVIADRKKYPSDMIILNINLKPNKDLKSLRKTMDFTLDDSGFMSQETLASGIYGVGTIFGPLDYKTTIDTTNDVALQIISLLSKDHLIAEFSGIEVDKDKFKCKGCGTCVSVCPTGAIEMNIDTSEKILRTIEILSKFKPSPKIIAFCCRSCGYAAADDAGLKKLTYNPNIFIVQVPCTGRVDTSFILKSFEEGFDGVMIVGCKQDACRYIDGVQKAQRKVKLLSKIMGSNSEKRIKLENLNAVEGAKFVEIVDTFYETLKEDVKYEA